MNQTKMDAQERICNGRIGCLAGNPSEVYHLEMQRLLCIWTEEITNKILEVQAKEELERSLKDCEVGDHCPICDSERTQDGCMCGYFEGDE